MRILSTALITLMSLFALLEARDHTTPLTVKPATEEETSVVLKLLKEHIEADTDDKRIAALHDLFTKLAVDSVTKRGKPLPELNANSGPVASLREEQPTLRLMHDSLLSKDGKCRAWRLVSHLERNYSDSEKPPRVIDASRSRPELIIQYTDGQVTYQKSFGCNSKSEWFTRVLTSKEQNPITVAP